MDDQQTWGLDVPEAWAEELQWCRRFVDEQLIPLEYCLHKADQGQMDRLFAPLKQQVKERGLWAAHLPPEDGGQGRGQRFLAHLHEVLGRSDLAPEVFGCQAPDSGNAELIAAGANEAQRERWLKPLLNGEMRSCFALTEAGNTGSDPTGIQTRCVKDGDHWRIDGEKWFASNASVADFIVVMAVTDPDAPPHKRAAMIVVPKGTPGLIVQRDVGTMHHPAHTEPGDVASRIGGHSELRFENCRVPLDHMIGQPGEGFILAQKRLGGGRIHHSMRMIGQCQRAFEMMKERAVSRQTRGRPLGNLQMVQAMIADSYVEIEMARLYVLQSAAIMDRYGAHSKAARKAIAASKFAIPNVLLTVLDRAIQLHGSLGYSSDMPLEAMYRSARALRVADGADDIHRQSVARLELEGVAAVDGWPSEHIPTAIARARQQFANALAEEGLL